MTCQPGSISVSVMIMEPFDGTKELGEGSESLDQAKRTITEIEMLSVNQGRLKN